MTRKVLPWAIIALFPAFILGHAFRKILITNFQLLDNQSPLF